MLINNKFTKNTGMKAEQSKKKKRDGKPNNPLGAPSRNGT